ncbi:MAG: PF20097 family protein [Oscillospiraceae bacterium]|nr:PF20097 family protein [Oscillospiraceae bacterium]
MTCPYCGEELIKGEVQSGQGGMIYWQPEPETEGFNKMRYTRRGVKTHGGIVLSGGQYNGSAPLVGYCCPVCKKIIVEYDEK